MFLARVTGRVVASAKDEGLSGRTLLICYPVRDIDAIDESAPGDSDAVVAVDLIGATEESLILVCTGSAARAAAGDVRGVDAAAVALVDYLVRDGRRIEPEW